MINKQKSLISVYDNSTDGEQQLTQQQSISSHSLPLVGIIGRNRRSDAFRIRLIQSNFPEPIVCDATTANSESNGRHMYVSHEHFRQLSPAIILLTDDLSTPIEHLFHRDKDYLFVDVRDIHDGTFTNVHRSLPLSSMSGVYRAFGNLSNWEIINGTQRVAVAVERTSPNHLMKFIADLQCFTRGVHLVDAYCYSNVHTESFRHCSFPFLSTLIVFSLCLIVSLVERPTSTVTIYRQASSITASTSLTLLAVLYLIRPTLESIDCCLTLLPTKQHRYREY
jgi:hypothetical protein